MEPGHYTDPLEEALNHGSQRVAQFASLVGAMAQVVIQRRALHKARTAARDDERAIQVLDEQERLIHHQARLTWSPALDAQWLGHADLLQTGRAWAGAASYADTDPLAASAMRKCEDRLRVLHPHAMTRYDRLRNDGVSPPDAMRDTAPLFSRSPNVRVGDPVPARPALTVMAMQDIGQPASHPSQASADHVPEADTDKNADLRGRQIITRIQASARAAKRPDLGPDELAMILEAATNLPDDVIQRITRQAATQSSAGSQRRRAAAATHTTDLLPATDLTSPELSDLTVRPAAAHGNAGTVDASLVDSRSERSAAELAAESFPHGAAEAVQAVSTGGTVRLAGLAHAPVVTKAHSRPM